MARLSKSEGVEAGMDQAREQSVMELIAKGAIKVELSPRQQLAYDDAVRFAAKIDADERSYYSRLPERIFAENRQVVEDLNAGKLYLANETSDGRHTIHFAACPSVRHQIDRDIAHAHELANGDQVVGSWHAGPGYDFVAKWPNLMTLQQVEQLRSYQAFRRCNPDTKQRRKYSSQTPKPSKITSVTPDRIGREYETVAGEYLGVLHSYTVTRDHIVLHCSERDYTGTR